MLLGFGVEDAGVGALVTALVALFGVAVKFLTAAAGTAADRFEAEITRLRADKDDTIDDLRRQITDLTAERDLWLNRYMKDRRANGGSA